MGQDLTEEAYQLKRKRAKRVSYFTGIFSVGVFAILLFVFLWNFWLEDLFRTAERVDVPDFTGKSYEAVVNDKQYADYHFTVVYTVDPDVPDGIIIEQDPAAGKSRMRVSDGINVQLTVSTGVVMTDVPYVINEDYEKATAALEKSRLYGHDGVSGLQGRDGKVCHQLRACAWRKGGRRVEREADRQWRPRAAPGHGA